jgi:hypothetical protein
VSKPGEIKPASTVNMIGKVEGDWKVLKTVKENQEVVVSEDER